MSRKRFWLIVMAVVVIIGGVTATVIAEPFWQIASEEGIEQEAFMGVQDTVIGDNPDENGYAGEIVTGSGELLPSEVLDEAEPSPEVLPQEPRPDEEGAVPNQGEIEWSDFYYNFSAGATMRPRASMTEWSYPGVGCVVAASGNELFTLTLDLPQGVRIDYLRILFYDSSSAKDSTAWITTYDGAGGVDDLISVSSTGSAGYGYVVSGYSGHVVDNVNNSYVLNYSPNQTGDSMRLCGLRVAYRYP
ncbi:MAG: hypothetical protein WA110_07605 [Anaerolineaceae bacterium]